MKLVLATNNRHKIEEITAILKDLDVTILTKDDFSDFPDPDETGSTLEENAILKAREIFDHTGVPSLADDSGIEVDALGGDPGVNSARYAGPGCTFADNNRKLLKALESVPREKRTARFRCVIAICFDNDNIELAEGRVDGVVTSEVRGKEGFGYDPIFEIPDLSLTFAEMPPEKKHSMSHRGRALEKARILIREYLEKSGK